MTTEQIELRVEKTTDRIDARFMGGELTQEQYDAEMKALDAWAEEQYAMEAIRIECERPVPFGS
jgi:hypothetical protein